MTRERDRDISEKIALGETAPTGQETVYDQRLFNQSQGIASGFGAEEDYNIYDKALFAGTSANEVYKPRLTEEDEWGDEDAAVQKVMNTARFKATKGFSGADGGTSQSAPKGQPVQFVDDSEADPFGLDQMISQASKK